MNKLVILKNNDIFIDSKVISVGTGNKHHSITAIIQKYEKDFEDFGKVLFKIEPLPSGQKEKVYQLNEEQATLLMTYLKNTEVVRKFKKELVKQFYQMRQILLEKQTELWQNTRVDAKVNRLAETSEIKLLVEYAKAQGSQNADRYYITFSKLANKAVGLDSKQRDIATASQLNNLALIEHIIGNVIKENIAKSVFYKEIYKECKNRIQNFLNIAYLQAI